LGATILIDYFAAILIEQKGLTARNKKAILIVSIVSTCLVLFVFKYFNFFNTNLLAVSNFFHWNYSISAMEIILPIGLSFHTFQSLSYVIEVYRGHQRAERHFGFYALYVMFFPQLVAGPIERPQNLLHQLRAEHAFDYVRVTDGLKLMGWGLFKKVVIADRLAIAVNMVYDNPHNFTGLPLIIATFFFAFQIYCDFSGYSDIAIGAAQVMGIRLMDNFNRPYFSKSIAEFWKRWHISLSTWFRDYLYIPLGGNRTKTWRWQFNLFVTFLVSGFWHGANWTYIIWGALHGFYLMFSIWTQPLRHAACHLTKLDRYPALHKYIKIAITFSLVCVAWIFFRARNINDAWYVLTHLLNLSQGTPFIDEYQLRHMGLSRYDLIVAIAAIIMMEYMHAIQRHRSIRHMLAEKPWWQRWTVYTVLILGLVFFGIFGVNQFIYFQF
jgi:D-alanyl-lipoteichoic acid acyltransferase DltB (MBOAT superfamily)